MAYPSETFPMLVYSVAGTELCCLNVQSQQLIVDVKSLLEEKLQVPSRFQSLIWKADALSDSSTVDQCGLATGATVVLVMESVGEDGLVQALRRDIESLLPREALDDSEIAKLGENPTVRRSGPIDDFRMDLDAANTKLGDMKQDETGFLMSKSSHSLLASYLLKSGADPNYTLPEDSLCKYGFTDASWEPDVGGTALHYAARLGLPDVCKQILEDKRFNKVNLKNGLGRAALHLSALPNLDELADGRNNMRAEVCRLLVQDNRCDVNLHQGFDEKDDKFDKYDELLGAKHDRKTALHLAGSCDVIVEALLSSSRVDCNIPHPGDDRFHPLIGCVNFNCCGGSRYANSLRTCLLLAKRPDIDLNAKWSGGGCTVPEVLLSYTDGHGDIEEELLAMEIVFEFVKNKRYDVAKCHLTDPVNDNGQVPLVCAAAAWGSPELLDYLVKDERIDPNEKSKNMVQAFRYGVTPFPASGQTLLHYACNGMSVSPWTAAKVRAVLQCSRFTESVNAQDELGQTAFHIATRSALANDWYKGDVQDFDEESPLAILWNEESLDVNVRNVEGKTALHMAISGGIDSPIEFVDKEELFEALSLANGLCGIFLRSKRFRVTADEINSFLVQTAFFNALAGGLLEDDEDKKANVVETFWAHPAITSLNGFRNDSLTSVVRSGQVELCKRLLDDPRFTAVNGKHGDITPLLAATSPEDPYEEEFSWQPFFAIIKMLVDDKRTDLSVWDVTENQKHSPLSRILGNVTIDEPRWLDFARTFLEDPRTDINHATRDGQTYLHRVCALSSDSVTSEEQLELCKMILQKKDFKGVNAKKIEDGNTALIVAACHSESDMSLKLVKALLGDERIDCSVMDHNEMTAREYADYFFEQAEGSERLVRKEIFDLLAARN